MRVACVRTFDCSLASAVCSPLPLPAPSALCAQMLLRIVAVVLVVTVLCSVRSAASVERNEDEAVSHLETEALTSASSLGGATNGAAAAVGAGAGAGAKQRGRNGAGACCRICPNTFYAIPRIVPRPQPKGGKPPQTPALSARALRFQSIFSRPEPSEYDTNTFSFVAFAEQLSSYETAGSGSRAKSKSDEPRPSRFGPQPDYRPWPEKVYTADPYQDQPIPLYTPMSSEQPGTNCCNVCAVPGASKLKYPDLLRWGENPATDNYPDPPYEIPCCKLCSAGCFSNGERRPPGITLRNGETQLAGDEDGSAVDAHASLSETGAKLTASGPVPSTGAIQNGAVLSETGSAVNRRKKPAPIARGNWPKTLDPPGANLPPVQLRKGCDKDIGCCSVCYNHPMIYDHAPSGIW